MLDEIMTNTITIIKSNGEKHQNIKSYIDDNQIHIEKTDILIEPMDIIQQSMSNGSLVKYQVIDPGFCESAFGIPAYYDVKVRKLGVSEPVKNVQIYSIHGDNSRINYQSTDHSINIIGQDLEIIQLIRSMHEVICSSSLQDQEKKEALEIVTAIESQCKSDVPSKKIITTLLAALPPLEQVVTIANTIAKWISSNS